MSDYSSRRISEAELAVLEVLWEKGEPLPAKAIQDELKERRGWERTTVRSLLTRLAERGTVTVDKTDVAVYIPSFQRGEYAWDLAEVLVERMYDGRAEALLADLCAHHVLSKAEVQAAAETL